ncbi:MAG: hypothetical protein PHZ09_13505 [Eubacteriales bacterium]|nr:hypothetical protein [Eubacteriales bacterium]
MSFTINNNIIIDGGTIANTDFIAEEETGEIFNDAVFARNRAVEETLDINIEAEVVGYGNTFVTALNTYIQAGDSSFHAAMGMNNISTDITSLVYSGKFIDWNGLEYFNPDMPWWDSNVIRDLAFGDKIYGMTGDFNPSTLGNTRVILFNKNLFSNLNIAYPYDSVLNNTWTHEKFKSVAAQGIYDLDGDGSMTYGDDRWGYVGWQWDTGESLFIGYGANYITKDADNLPVLNMNNEYTVNAIDRILELFAEGAGGWMNTVDWGHDITIFNDGRSLMLNSRLYLLNNFRDMSDDFGIVTHPKLSEEQDGYYQSVDAVCTICYIPISNDAPEFTGIVLELTAYESWRTVMPGYYEVVLQTKYTRDNESEQMIDIIKNNRCFPLQLNSFSFITIADFIRNNKNTLSSVYAANEAKALKELDDIIACYAAG